MIEIRPHNHASELISLSGPYLEQNECENNLPIGLAYRLAEDPYYYTSELPVLLSILEQGQVVGVAVMTPPKRIILSRIDTDIQAAAIHLVRHLLEINRQIPGVVGPAVEAQAFADGWVEGVLGISVRLSKQMRVFEARTVADLPLSTGTDAFRTFWTTIHSWLNGLSVSRKRLANLSVLRVLKAAPRNSSTISNYTYGIMKVRSLLLACPVQ